MNDNPIKVLVVEPGKDPYVQEIDGSLKSMQALVGGYIETVPILDEPGPAPAEIVCNEEGKLLGLTPNRLLKDSRGVPYDVVCGTFFVAGVNDGDFASLTDAQIALYKSKYSREKLYELPDGRYASRPPKKKGERSHER